MPCNPVRRSRRAAFRRFLRRRLLPVAIVGHLLHGTMDLSGITKFGALIDGTGAIALGLLHCTESRRDDIAETLRELHRVHLASRITHS